MVDNDLPINITFDLDKEDLPDIVLEGGKKVCLQTNEPEVEEGCARFYIEKKSKKNARNLVTGLKNLKAFSSMLQQSSHTSNTKERPSFVCILYHRGHPHHKKV